MTKKTRETLTTEKIDWLRRTIRDVDLERTAKLASAEEPTEALIEVTEQYRQAQQSIVIIEKYLAGQSETAAGAKRAKA